MSMMKRLKNSSQLTSCLAFSLVLVACGTAVQVEVPVDQDFEGVLDDVGALTDLSDRCAHAVAGGAGTLTITLEANDVAVVSLGTGGAILINGFSCADATTNNTRIYSVVENGSNSAQTLVIDYSGGIFGLANRTPGTGFVVDLGGGNDALRFRGSRGNDRFVFGTGGVTVNADNYVDVSFDNVESFVASMGPGNDNVTGVGSSAAGAAFPNDLTIYGGEGNDVLAGGEGDDTLNGGPGDDTIVGGEAANGGDVMIGGDGTDTADFSARTASVSVTVDNVADDGAGSEADDVQDDIENVRGGDGDDTITGSAENNILFGGDGDDTLSGGGGDDTLNGELGDDTFDADGDTGADIYNGGAGVDTADYSARTATLAVSLNGRADDGADGEEDNVRTDVENLTGGTAGDTLLGSAAANILIGGPGDDELRGGNGADTLIGGGGSDEMYGDSGNDTFDEGVNADIGESDVMDGGAGADLVDYSGRTITSSISLDDQADDGAVGENDNVGVTVENVRTGTAADYIMGSDFANVIESSGGNDEIHGMGGNDTIEGGDDQDEIYGGDGDDTISGGAGVDDIEGGDGDDTIDGDAGLDTLLCGGGDGDVCIDGADCDATCEL